MIMRNLKTLFSAARLLLYTLLFLLSTECVFAQKVKPGVSIGHALKVVAFDFSPNEKFIVSAGEDGVVKLWETKTGRLVKDWDPAPDRSGSFKYTSDVAFLDDQYILVATNGKPLQRWEFASTGENSVEAFLDSKLTEQPTVRAFRVHHDSKEMLVVLNRPINPAPKWKQLPNASLLSAFRKMVKWYMPVQWKAMWLHGMRKKANG